VCSSRVTPVRLLEEHLVVITSSREVRGAVTDGSGSFLSGVQVRLEVPAEAVASPSIPSQVENARHEAVTASDGAFAFPGVADVGGIRLLASRDGYRTFRQTLPGGALTDLEVPLSATFERQFLLTGSVADSRGRPVPGAQVRIGKDETRSDGGGRFRLPVRDPVDTDALGVVRVGVGGALLEEIGRRLLEAGGEAVFVEVALSREQWVIEGEVRDPGGGRFSNWFVQLHEVIQDGAGEALIDLSRGPLASWQGSRLDVSGRFVLRGIGSGGRYVVRAVHKGRGLIVESEPVMPGTRPVILRVPAGGGP